MLNVNFTEPNLCDTSAPSVQTDTWVPLHTFIVVGPQQKHFQAVATETERVKRSTRATEKLVNVSLL